MSLDLVKVTLLNGNNDNNCVGNKITTVVTQEGSGKPCYSKEKGQIQAGSRSIWNIQDLGGNCKKVLYDPDKEIKVQVRTEGAPGNGFCPIKVELEILDIVSNTPRYFCSEMNKKKSFRGNNNDKYNATEERCFSN